ncbi:ankyrin repeat and SAM domain-containing protein 3 isoform X1 [Hypanus sabinus]|uniref:ankyrin repeat and SAM domain-containing protein 3 isoform X1 n=2 Tax=Hypanus sabinus TaxID=79690 RepID=UPI0028C4F69B|nr:ankyrin repeat and SAM domain-containing protein 3 isoform X1 [Hypanus sabinus]XP_059834827.1 ankyrin repeat and SAM domain-containing protein 3 isoform X1 [Hypanus sabinus]
MSELSDEASESELLNRSLSMWHGFEQLMGNADLDVPLDIHTAASIGQYDVVKQWIQGGEVNANQKNQGGWTPLMYASYIGHDTIVHLLLEAGVDVNTMTERGQSALMLAASCGNESIAYFLLQQGAEMEMKDSRGWTALFHCTSTGHQQMVKFLLDNGADANVREPTYGFTPLMEAAASGHEIIVQYLLNHDVQVDVKDDNGDTARSLALTYGYMKIASLIDLHTAPVSKSVRRDTGIDEDFSSSDEFCPFQLRPLSARHPQSRRTKGPSIHDGPQALAHITRLEASRWARQYESLPPQGYVTFRNSKDEDGGDIRNRDVTSPINEHDVESNSSREENAFCTTDTMTTRRSSGSSSEGLTKAQGISREGSVESNEDSDHSNKNCNRRQPSRRRGQGRSSESSLSRDSDIPTTASSRTLIPQEDGEKYHGPKDLPEFLEQIGCLKYLHILEEQDVDLRIFLTLTESDLKEVGITLFGPKRKMTAAIARWHSNAPPLSNSLEQVYADRLETEMQEMAIQLHKKCEEAELLTGRVSQEQELRAVVEGVLMEDKMAWKQQQKQIKETQGVCHETAIILEQVRAYQSELLSRFTEGSGQWEKEEVQKVIQSPEEEGLADWKSVLGSLSIQELSTTLEKHTLEMGKVVRRVERNLQNLLKSDKKRMVWAQNADL